MITTRSPLRISLGGGGTDLPSYYREHGGFLIAGAIDKYVYVNVMRPFTPRSDQDARLQDAPGRNHHACGHSIRHRTGIIRKLHHRAAEGALRTSDAPD